MGFNGAKITQYKDGRDAATGTLARGSTFDNEFTRLYDNDNYLKGEIDKLGGASIDTDGTLSGNSDLKIASQKAAKAYMDAKIATLIGGAPSALDTLNELAAALNNDAGLANTLLAKVEASEQQNLVYNYDFRYFSNQLSTIASWYSYKHPDGWVYTDSGTDGKIGYDTSLECCKLQTSSDGAGSRSLKQALHEFVNWKKLLQGKTVTCKAFVKGANATVKITDGVTSQSAALQNTGGIEEITLQIAVSAVATELTFLIESATASNTIEVYKVYANRGNYAIETLPCIIQGKIGDIMMFGSEVVGLGDYLCNASALPRSTYSRLFSVIKTKYGSGDGSTTFNLPNYSAVVPKGTGDQTINTRLKSGPAFAVAEEDRGQLHSHTNGYCYAVNNAGSILMVRGSGSAEYGGFPLYDSGGGTPRMGDTTRENTLGTTFVINFGRTK